MLTRQRPVESKVVARFDDQAPRYHARYGESSASGHSFRMRERRLYEMFDKPGRDVLDIGCGPGITVAHLTRLGCRVHGVDLSEAMVAECRRAFGHVASATFSVGRIERLDAPDASYDAVICMGVVEYIADDEAAVREMARVARPGATVLISLPNRLSLFRIWRRGVFRPAAEGLRRLLGKASREGLFHREYRAGEYDRLLRAHGLEPVEHVYYNFKLIPSPLDEWLPGLTVRTTTWLEGLGRSPLGWLGTSLIVKAIRGHR